MARIIEHKRVDHSYFIMKVESDVLPEPGQFYMLHPRNEKRLLGRPISVYDAAEGYVSFLYQVVGEGTAEFTTYKEGEDVTLYGPYGNRFPKFKGKKIGCVGGGVGIAPFYYLVKEYAKDNEMFLYLGLREDSSAEWAFSDLPGNLIVQKGGFVTDGVPYGEFDVLFTCGPKVMMEKVVQGARAYKKEVYVSMEERMGCGFGGCLGCSTKTVHGNRRVCKDGPIFPGEEVFYESLTD